MYRMYYEEANQKQQLQRPSNRNKKATIYTPLDCEGIDINSSYN